MQHYEVRVKQEVPYYDPSDESFEPSGYIQEYTAGRFDAKHMAIIFAKALEDTIAASQGYVVTAYTPEVFLVEISNSDKYIDYKTES